jgi:hypothetical protein
MCPAVPDLPRQDHAALATEPAARMTLLLTVAHTMQRMEKKESRLAKLGQLTA